jgi:hypothetical protein
MDRNRARRAVQQNLYQQVIRITALIIGAVLPLFIQIIRRYLVREPYHTSILTGQGWVDELLEGHSEHIHTELGMHKHVFLALVSKLRDLGHTNSKYVSLEEQVAIFLYACVTGLTVRHLGERFQRSNETISK